MKARKRSDRGTWEVRWSEGGRYRSQSFERKGDADAWIDDFRRRRLLGLPSLEAGRVTLAEFMELWWATYAVPNLASRTRKTYGHIWERHIRKRLGGYALREITPEVILDFRAQLHAQHVGHPTIIKAMGLLQGILKHAVVRGHLATNPLLVVDKPRQRTTRRIAPLAPSVIEAIRCHMPTDRDRLLTSLMGYQGLRPDEATHVRVADIGRRTLTVYAPKTRRERVVDLLAPVEQEIREYLLSSGIRDGLLFPRPGGREWSDTDWRNWRRRVYQGTPAQPAKRGKRAIAARPGAAAKAGVTGDMRPYRLRGSFVSLLLWEGRSVAYVAEQAGHDVATLAAHYAGVLRELEDAPRVPAAQAILAARGRVAGELAGTGS